MSDTYFTPSKCKMLPKNWQISLYFGERLEIANSLAYLGTWISIASGVGDRISLRISKAL